MSRVPASIPFSVLLSGCLLLSPAVADDWLGFRGDGSSYAPESNTPVEFDTKSGQNIAWRVNTTGRGIGGPLVVDDQVIVTGCGGEDERDLYVEAYSVESGELNWSRPMRATGRPYTHPTSSNASPTPASDGERVFALFSSCDLLCYDLQGHLQWYRALAVDHPKTGNDVSMSSSPVVIDGVVIVQLENQGDSFAAGIDAITGDYLWKVDRSPGSNWSTPQPIQVDESVTAVGMHNGGSMDLLNAKSGELIKHFDIPGDRTASSTFASPYIIVPGEQTTAIRISVNDSGSTEADVEWESNQLRPQRASPVVSDDRVYMSRGSTLVAGSISDGSILWKTRIGKINTVWATPVMTASGIYVIGSDGSVFVVQDNGDKGKVIAESDLGEAVLASPAVADDCLYFRSEKGLIKVANQ